MSGKLEKIPETVTITHHADYQFIDDHGRVWLIRILPAEYPLRTPDRVFHLQISTEEAFGVSFAAAKLMQKDADMSQLMELEIKQALAKSFGRLCPHCMEKEIEQTRAEYLK